MGKNWPHGRMTVRKSLISGRKYFHANVSILLGARSALWWLDLDSEEATEEASRKGVTPWAPSELAGAFTTTLITQKMSSV